MISEEETTKKCKMKKKKQQQQQQQQTHKHDKWAMICCFGSWVTELRIYFAGEVMTSINHVMIQT